MKKKRIQVLQYILIIGLLLSMVGLLYLSYQRIQMKKEVVSIKDSKLVLYEGPKSLRDATKDDLKATSESLRDFSLLHCTDTKITVNGYDSYVYDTNVNHTRKWVSDYMPPISRTPITYFDFEGAAVIEVEVPELEIESVKISPVSYKINPTIDKLNHRITFTITTPDSYTITWNDSPDRAVHIFANELETDIPDPNDEKVVYIGPGEWDIETIILEDGQTLYLAGGAVVHGIVNANFAKNITVRGRGIIDGSKFEGWKGKGAYIPLKFDNCDNVALKDIIVLNSNAWVCQAYNSTNGIIDGIKIISPRPNGDGITLQSCTNYEVKNSFVRSWDDSLVIKNYAGSSEKISFSNMQLWTDLAQSMEIGYETNKGNINGVYIKDISFEDITVLNNYHKPVISIHNGDDAVVSDISFNNIVVENAKMGSGDGDVMPYLIDLHIGNSSNWSTTKERGVIKDIIIDGVTVLSGKFNESRIQGFDENHRVENVTIKNITILNEKIKNFKQGKFIIDETSTNNIKMK